MSERTGSRPGSCPPWCSVSHGLAGAEDDLVHVGEAVAVSGAALARLVLSVDPVTGRTDGPYLLVGNDELTVEEARRLGTTLVAMADSAAALLPAQQPEGALPVLDPELAEHGRDVDPDGGRGDEQPGGDLLGGGALGEQLHDLPLPRAELGGGG